MFVSTPDAIAGLDKDGIAEKLAIPKNAAGYRVFEFDTPAGLASPIRRTDEGFIGGGKTAGGAPEWVIPNGPFPFGTIESRVVGDIKMKVH